MFHFRRHLPAPRVIQSISYQPPPYSHSYAHPHSTYQSSLSYSSSFSSSFPLISSVSVSPAFSSVRIFSFPRFSHSKSRISSSFASNVRWKISAAAEKLRDLTRSSFVLVILSVAFAGLFYTFSQLIHFGDSEPIKRMTINELQKNPIRSRVFGSASASASSAGSLLVESPRSVKGFSIVNRRIQNEVFEYLKVNFFVNGARNSEIPIESEVRRRRISRSQTHNNSISHNGTVNPSPNYEYQFNYILTPLGSGENFYFVDNRQRLFDEETQLLKNNERKKLNFKE